MSPDTLGLRYYDSDKNYIGYTTIYNSWRESPANAYYLRFIVVDTTTYNHDICINFHYDGTRDGEYEPYTEHSYPLDDSLTLRGIPKLDADNNLYYDGDTYEHDGTVTRRYGIVDLGTLTWQVTDASTGVFWLYTTGGSTESRIPNIKITGNNNESANFRMANYETIPMSVASPKPNMTCWQSFGGQYGQYFGIRNESFIGWTTAQVKTAMNGVYLVYELATPTTETADAYQKPQIVDNWGTEEFVVTEQSGVEIPVGHETVYPISLRDKLESAPNLPDGDGDYLLHMASGEATYKQLVSEFPSAPTTNGTYVLKATVSSGTATLSWVAES